MIVQIGARAKFTSQCSNDIKNMQIQPSDEVVQLGISKVSVTEVINQIVSLSLGYLYFSF